MFDIFESLLRKACLRISVAMEYWSLQTERVAQWSHDMQPLAWLFG